MNLGWTFFQAFSTVTTTLTTVGYGDFGYTKRSTRIFLIFYIFIGVAYTTAAFGSLVSWIIARERKSQFKNLTDMEKPELSKAFTSRMQEAGLWDDGPITREEFQIFLLLQMGRVNEEQIKKLDHLYSSIAEGDAKFIPYNGGKATDDSSTGGDGAGGDGGVEGEGNKDEEKTEVVGDEEAQ